MLFEHPEKVKKIRKRKIKYFFKKYICSQKPFVLLNFNKKIDHM